MARTRILAPSLLSADFSRLGEEVRFIDQSAAQWVHLDIMDGSFVPNISFGLPVVGSIRGLTEKPFDAHLMIQSPDRYIGAFAEVGVNILTVHHEACTHLQRTVSQIRSHGMRAGVALNPHTPPELLRDILGDIDMVLIMSVNPGFGGQRFLPRALGRVARLRALAEVENPSLLIEVDGGVNPQNARSLYEAGADILVAGNAVFGAKDRHQAVHDLLNA